MNARGLVFGVALALAASPAAARSLHVKTLSPPVPVPRFSLQDAHGRPYSTAQLKGHWSLLYMGFTHCTDICPMTLANLADIEGRMAKLPGGKRPAIVFLAVDPKRDRPVLAKYLSQYGSGIIGVTGPQKAVDAVATGLGGFVVLGTPDAKGDYDMAHSAEVSVIDPRARVRARLMPPMPAAETARYLAALFAGAGRTAENQPR